MSRFIIVNEKDELIGYKKRSDITSKDTYRVSALWVNNKQEEILLARRAFTKSKHPGRWGPAVAGTVEEGEEYKDNIAKETEEELGIRDVTFREGPKLRSISEYSYFVQWFKAEINQPLSYFTIQKDEVAEIKWWKKEELRKALLEMPNEFLPGMKRDFELFVK